jgi:hypothetical protein
VAVAVVVAVALSSAQPHRQPVASGGLKNAKASMRHTVARLTVFCPEFFFAFLPFFA